MVSLTQSQVQDKIKFINDYINAKNAADGSKYDANANVSNKNIATLSAELFKNYTISINRHLVYEKLKENFDTECADEFLRQLKDHEIYVNDETSLMPYCASVSLYPFLLNGLKGFGGETESPKHLSSYCGGFINLIFALSSQFAGAIACVEFLLGFDHFATKDYGKNYLETHTKEIEQEIQSVVYALNQPAAARGYQSVFFNTSIYDKYYFESMFGNFVFPDMTKPDYNSVNKLQKFFMKWFNKERTKAVLTFPVVTAACINNGNELKDKDFEEFISTELSEGNSFFIYTSDSADSLSSCCRLRNDISDSNIVDITKDYAIQSVDGQVLSVTKNTKIKYNNEIYNIDDFYSKYGENVFKMDVEIINE